MKNSIITTFCVLFILISCKKEEPTKETFKCRDAEVIEKANYSIMTNLQVSAYRRDSLITESENLILCEECEITDWKWTSYSDIDSSMIKYFFYSENTDTVALFEIVNQYQESSRMSEYIIQYNDTTDLPQLFICFVMSNEIPSHVECLNGIPVLKMKNK